MEEKLEQLQRWIEESRRIVFFGGAGVSTESGIPDFRGTDGLSSRTTDVPMEELLSRSYFLAHPDRFYASYKPGLLREAKPNAAHYKLAEWEAQGKLLSVVTQNIDGLHQRAGSKRVWELHGSVARNHCMACGKFFEQSYLLGQEGIPCCDSCGGMIKPDVVLYQEPLDPETLEGAASDIASADMLMVGGTSLVVYPAAGLLRYYKGDRLVLINRTPTGKDKLANLILTGNIGEILGAL